MAKPSAITDKRFSRIKRIARRARDTVRVNYALWRLGVLKARRIPTYTQKTELYSLFMLARNSPRNSCALEIGSYLGASACYLIAGLAKIGAHLVCVDTWHNETMTEGKRDTYNEFLRNIKPASHYITVIRKQSNELSAGEIPDNLHLIFIDGDHDYAAAKADFDFAAPKLAHEGRIALHDWVYYEGVSRVVKEALISGRWVVDGYVGNLIWLKQA